MKWKDLFNVKSTNLCGMNTWDTSSPALPILEQDSGLECILNYHFFQRCHLLSNSSNSITIKDSVTGINILKKIVTTH